MTSSLFTSLRFLGIISFIFLSGALLGCKSNFFGNRVGEPVLVPLAEYPAPGIAVRDDQPLPPGRGVNPALQPITDMETSVYVISKGDTLWSIARSHRTSVLTLQRLNGISDSFIRYGDKLQVPAEGALLLAKEKKAAPNPEPLIIPAPAPAPAPAPVPVPAAKQPVPAAKQPAPAAKEAGDGLGFGGDSAPRPKPRLQKDKDGFLRLPPQP